MLDRLDHRLDELAEAWNEAESHGRP